MVQDKGKKNLRRDIPSKLSDREKILVDRAERGELLLSAKGEMESALESIQRKIDRNQSILNGEVESSLYWKNQAAEWQEDLLLYEGKLLFLTQYWRDYSQGEVPEDPDLEEREEAWVEIHSQERGKSPRKRRRAGRELADLWQGVK